GEGGVDTQLAGEDPTPCARRHRRRRERNQSGHENDWGKAPRTRELPVLQHHRHLPKPVLVVLAKDASQRSTWRVVNADRRVEDDPSPGQPNTKVEFVVLVPPQRLVEEAEAGGGLGPKTLRNTGGRDPTLFG